MNDDVAATVAALQAEGIEIAKPISDQGWGLLTAITLPGGSSSVSTNPVTQPRRNPAERKALSTPAAIGMGRLASGDA
jgi:hypothetical protein